MTLVRLATPAYKGQTTLRYAIGLANLTQDFLFAESPVRLHSIDGAPDHLITARNVLLWRALAMREVDVLLWVDADCALTYQNPQHLWNFIAEARRHDVAMVGVECARRSGTAGVSGSNVVPLREETSPRDKWSPYEVRAVGMGICAWNLKWWRRQLVATFPQTGLATSDVRDVLHFFEWRDGMSEDHRACEWARNNGGLIIVDPAIGSVHDGATVEPKVGRIARPS